MATANGMLILGVSKVSGPKGQVSDCYFQLPEYLMWTGCISLMLVIMGFVVRYIIGWLMMDGVISAWDLTILRGLRVLTLCLVATEMIMLLFGAVLAFSHLPGWQSEHKDEDNYCDFGLVVFTCIFSGISLFFILLGGSVGLYIGCFASKAKPPKEGFFIEKP
jgi:hypothetical protein